MLKYQTEGPESRDFQAVSLCIIEWSRKIFQPFQNYSLIISRGTVFVAVIIFFNLKSVPFIKLLVKWCELSQGVKNRLTASSLLLSTSVLFFLFFWSVSNWRFYLKKKITLAWNWSPQKRSCSKIKELHKLDHLTFIWWVAFLLTT